MVSWKSRVVPKGVRKPATAKARRWQLQEAKAKFSEVFDRAYSDGPQVVTRRNKKAVVILPEEDYEKLTQKKDRRSPSLVEVFLAMPRVPGFKIPERDKNDMGREPPKFD